MHKHIKNFGRELAFLLVLVLTLSSGGLQVFATSTSSPAMAKLKALLVGQGNTLTIDYKPGGYTKSGLLTEVGNKMQSLVRTVASYTGVTVVATNTSYSIRITYPQSDSSIFAFATVVTAKANSTQLVAEAAIQLQEAATGTATSIGICVTSNNTNTAHWWIDYEVGGYENFQAQAAAATEKLGEELLKTARMGARVVPKANNGKALRALNLSAVIPTVNHDGSKFNLTLRHGTTGPQTVVTNIDVIVHAPDAYQFVEEAVAVLNAKYGGQLPLPYIDGGYANTTAVIAAAEAALKTFINTQNATPYASGRIRDISDATVTLTYVAESKVYNAKVIDDNGNGTDTSINFDISMAPPSKPELVLYALDLVDGTVTVPFNGTSTNYEEMAPRAETAVVEKINSVNGDKPLPVTQDAIDGLTVAVERTSNKYRLTISVDGYKFTKDLVVTRVDEPEPPTPEEELLDAADDVINADGKKINISSAISPANNALVALEAAAAVERKLLANDIIGVDVDVVWSKDTYTYKLTLSIDGEDSPSSPITLITVHNNKYDIVLGAKDALEEAGNAVVIPNEDYDDEDAMAAAAAEAVEAFLEGENIDDVTAEVTWDEDAGKYRLLLYNGQKENSCIIELGVTPVEIPDEDEVDMEDYNAAVALANKALTEDADKYTEDSLQAFEEAVEGLLELTEEDGQEAIDEATADITDALDLLVEKTPAPGDKAGWVLDPATNRYSFYLDGEKVIGLLNLFGELYYFDAAGLAVFGWYSTEGDNWYCFYPYALTGAQTLTDNGVDNRYLFAEDGKLIRGWYTADGGATYAFYLPYMLTGWHDIGTTTYYFDPTTGVALTNGTHIIGGVSYTFAPDGALIK